MRKLWKKFAAVAFTAVMGMALFAGCGASGTSSSASSSAASSAESGQEASSASGDTIENDGDKTIGVVFYSKTDALGSVVYSLVNEAARVWGVNVKWEIGGLDNETQLNSVQNLISGGVDGIVIIPLADTVTQKTSEMCEEHQVYFSLCFRDIIDEDIREQVIANPYFVGMTYEEDYETAKQMVKIAADKGCTKAGVSYNAPTVPYEAAVTSGFNDGMEEYGIEKVAEFTASDSGDVNVSTSNIENFLSAYPDMDLVLSGSGSNGVAEASIQLLEGTGVKLATRDFFVGMREAFENDTLAVAVGGMAPDALYSFAMCYNAVCGTPIEDSYISCTQPYLCLTSAEDCDVYDEYFGEDLSKIGDIYTEDFLNSLLKSNNSELNAEKLQEIMNEYSMEWIQKQANQ